MYSALTIASVCLMAVCLPCYVVAIKPGYSWKTLILKMVCSTAFLLIALFSALKTGTLNGIYAQFMIFGFACSWVGDVMLHLDPGMVRIAIGVVFFLAAHVFFIYAYVKNLGGAFISAKEIIAICVIWAIVIAAALIMKLKLNIYALAVVIYGTVLMFMLIKAFELGMSFAPASYIPAVLLTGGALLFTISDATLAAGFFGKKSYKGSVINITTYFIGQTLLALSVLVVK